MLVGLKSGANIPLTSADPELNAYLECYIDLKTDDRTLVLTDEYAPVEFFANKALK